MSAVSLVEVTCKVDRAIIVTMEVNVSMDNNTYIYTDNRNGFYYTYFILIFKFY
jgi:hypothetical protein